MWWLSFIDEDRPEGERFLGAIVVRAKSMPEAVEVTHALGINPGGLVGGLTWANESEPPESYHDRLLSSADIADMERELLARSETPPWIIDEPNENP